MKIRPLNDWVLLEEPEAEEMTSGGIIIPQVAKEKPQWGIVLAVGPGVSRKEKKEKKEEKRFVATEVKPGDRVLFQKYMAKEFDAASEKVLMVREEYILGILSEESGAGKSLQKKGSSALEKKTEGAVAKKSSGAVEKSKKKAPAAKTKTKE